MLRIWNYVFNYTKLDCTVLLSFVSQVIQNRFYEMKRHNYDDKLRLALHTDRL